MPQKISYKNKKKSGKSAFHCCNNRINSILQSNAMKNYCISSYTCPHSKKCPPPRPFYQRSSPLELSPSASLPLSQIKKKSNSFPTLLITFKLQLLLNQYSLLFLTKHPLGLINFLPLSSPPFLPKL